MKELREARRLKDEEEKDAAQQEAGESSCPGGGGGGGAEWREGRGDVSSLLSSIFAKYLKYTRPLPMSLCVYYILSSIQCGCAAMTFHL